MAGAVRKGEPGQCYGTTSLLATCQGLESRDGLDPVDQRNRHLQVWIGDELIVEDTVLVKDAWKGMLAGAFVGFAAPILLLASLYAVYAFWF